MMKPSGTPPTRPGVSTYSLARAIEEMGAAMVFPRDAEIYRENSPATYLYKVISGTVRTFKALSNGRRQIRAFYLPGEIFGVETGPEHAFSAEAITEAKLLVIERKAVVALAARDNTSALEPNEPRAQARAKSRVATDPECTRTRSRLPA